MAITSISPSPSRSLIANPNAPFKFASMFCAVPNKVPSPEPSFSYQSILSALRPVAMISLSPSRSRSEISRPYDQLRLDSTVSVKGNVGVSLVIAVGLVLPRVAEPPDIDKVKSPISRAPRPLSVS